MLQAISCPTVGTWISVRTTITVGLIAFSSMAVHATLKPLSLVRRTKSFDFGRGTRLFHVG